MRSDHSINQTHCGVSSFAPPSRFGLIAGTPQCANKLKRLGSTETLVPTIQRIPVLLFYIAILFAVNFSAYSQSVASDSEIWAFRSEAEKTAYLLGFCEGANGRKDSVKGLAELTCSPLGEKSKGALFRACGVVSTPKHKNVINWMNSFYSGEKYSDIPFWAAVAAFNDHECNEQSVNDLLPSLQARGKCFRGMSATFESGVSKELRDKIFAECARK